MTVHLCLISDDNYVMPTCVALRSIIASKNPESRYVIHIIASALSGESKAAFSKLATESVEIDIIEKDPSVLEGLHTFAEGAVCVASVSALFKFLLPNILVDLDRVLYLDGDLICRTDLTDLFNTELGDNYVAAVPDSGQIYYKHAYVKRVTKYINSGVMLLNLAKMRADNLPEVLVRTKKELTDSNLMDQNVFNVVFDHHIVYLPVRYNFMPVSLWRAKEKWKIADVNELFGTSYKSVRDLYHDAAIVHYSSKDKPWKAPDGAMSYLWREYGVELPQNAMSPMVSVIIPMYNVEGYIDETLDSVLNQSFRNIEVVCLDDGSSDGTVAVVRKRAKRDGRIRIIENENHHQAWERNLGIELAKGKYVYYMDSDDILKPTCLELIVSRAERDGLDLLFFEADSFYENSSLEKDYAAFKTIYHRKGVYPGVWNGKSLYVALRMGGDGIVSPCLQLVRREVLMRKNIRFPVLKCHEDNLYVVEVLLSAERVSCFTDVLYKRRVRVHSTMTGKGAIDDAEAFGGLVGGFLRLALTETDKDVVACLSRQVEMFIKRLQQFGGLEDGEAKVKRLMTERRELEGKVKFRGRYITAQNDLLQKCRHEIASLKSSEAYRVGMFVTWPARRAYRMFKCYRENGLKYTLRRLILGKGRGR